MTMLPQSRECSPPSPTGEHNQIFSELYSDYFPKIYNYIRYRVDSVHDADDLTSLTFIKLLDKRDQYKPEVAPFSVWVFAIARNTLTDYYRCRMRSRCASLDSAEKLADRMPGPEETTARDEIACHLHKALASLTNREREIIALKFWSGCSNRDIAGLLDISQSNTGIILYRAMRRLRKILESQGVCIDEKP